MGSVMCAACTRVSHDGLTLCAGCGDRLADKLAAVGDLHSDLQVTHARWDVLTVSAGRGGESGLPYKEAASAASRTLVSTLGFWAWTVAEQRTTPWDVPESLTEVSRWLLWRLDWLRALSSALEAYTQLDVALSRARSVIDRPTHRTSFAVGPCPETREDRYCPGEVWAYVPLRVGEHPALLRCRNQECVRYRDPWLPQSWMRVGERILRRRRCQRGVAAL